jgi:DNA-binding transcriptional regulator GbsR (MarR family)
LKRKTLLCMALTLVLCFSVVFVTSAAQTSAKDLILAGIKNFDPGVNKAFYEKSQDVTNIKISEFDGSLTKDAGPVKGASIDLISQLDAANNTIKISYTTAGATA